MYMLFYTPCSILNNCYQTKSSGDIQGSKEITFFSVVFLSFRETYGNCLKFLMFADSSVLRRVH